MKIKFISLFLLILIVNNLNSQVVKIKVNSFVDELNRYNLFFHMPNGFIAPDSTISRVFLHNHMFDVDFQISSNNDSMKVFYFADKQTKEMETTAKAFFPDRDMTTQFIKFSLSICKIIGDENFCNSEVSFYTKKENKKLNADQAFEYLIKLKKPFEEKYTYLKIRSIYKMYFSRVIVFQYFDDLAFENRIDKEFKKMIGFKK